MLVSKFSNSKGFWDFLCKNYPGTRGARRDPERGGLDTGAGVQGTHPGHAAATCCVLNLLVSGSVNPAGYMEAAPTPLGGPLPPCEITPITSSWSSATRQGPRPAPQRPPAAVGKHMPSPEATWSTCRQHVDRPFCFRHGEGGVPWLGRGSLCTREGLVCGGSAHPSPWLLVLFSFCVKKKKKGKCCLNTQDRSCVLQVWLILIIRSRYVL